MGQGKVVHMSTMEPPIVILHLIMAKKHFWHPKTGFYSPYAINKGNTLSHIV